MGAITLDGILRAEHDKLKEASDEWLGMSRDGANDDLQWVLGVIDFADALIDKLEGKDGNSDG